MRRHGSSVVGFLVAFPLRWRDTRPQGRGAFDIVCAWRVSALGAGAVCCCSVCCHHEELPKPLLCICDCTVLLVCLSMIARRGTPQYPGCHMCVWFGLYAMRSWHLALLGTAPPASRWRSQGRNTFAGALYTDMQPSRRHFRPLTVACTHPAWGSVYGMLAACRNAVTAGTSFDCFNALPP